MTIAEIPISGISNAAGVLRITIQPTARQTWIVSQVSISMSSGATSALCAVYKNGFLISPLVAPADTAAGDPPITLHTGDKMWVEWTGTTPGSVGKALFIYDDGK